MRVPIRVCFQGNSGHRISSASCPFVTPNRTLRAPRQELWYPPSNAMGRFNEAADPQMALAARAERPRVLRLHTDLISRVSRRTNVVKRDFDLIVYGATGYTGRLIAEYLAMSYRGDDAPSWAIAGRSTDKLQKVRADIGAPDDLPLVRADAAEPASLRSMCERAAVIITAVGPYQLHGPELVAACAATGTAYVDLCGEPAWMRRMIDAHHEEAKRTGARIVFSCGFDSIPFDLGVLTLQEKAREKFGSPATRR